MNDSESLQLTLVSVESNLVFDVDWVEVEAPNGLFTICLGHFNIASELKPGGEVSFKKPSGAITTLKVNGGIVSCNEGKSVTVIIFNN